MRPHNCSTRLPLPARLTISVPLGLEHSKACLCDPAIRWHYHFRWSVGHSFAEFHVFDAHSGEDVDGSIVAYGYFVRACSSCQSNRVLQSTKPKKGSLHVMSHEATRDEAAVSGTTWMRSSSESAVVAFLQYCLPA